MMANSKIAQVEHHREEDTDSEHQRELDEGLVDRPTEELIIGMVGAVGAGVSKASEVLSKILKNEYGYDVTIIKASNLIRENAEKVSHVDPAASGSERIKDLQSIGTELRDKFGENYIAAKAIESIAVRRRASGGYEKSRAVPQPLRIRQATIIDSLKHPKESVLFRRVYGGMYWQFTIFAPESVRAQRLKVMGINPADLSGIFTRDENDKEGDHGQKVSKTAYLSDFFIRNDGENEDRLNFVIERFLQIIFNISVHTPTNDEAGMYAAVSAAAKSACLSRQVGAAIYSASGELLSVGWNDVPKGTGGLYSTQDGSKDHRCFKWGGRLCHNDRKKDDLYEKIFSSLQKSGFFVNGIEKESVFDVLKETPIKDIIEYSRSIHAEMEAIVSAARSGKHGIVGGILYTTTFPCHNCARHIVAAGISKVYYVEPYSKSLALELHSDAITTISNEENKCAFLQYEGVGPDTALKLFHHGLERKRNGQAIINSKTTARPVMPPPMDGFTTHEKRVIKQLERVEGEGSATNPGASR